MVGSMISLKCRISGIRKKELAGAAAAYGSPSTTGTHVSPRLMAGGPPADRRDYVVVEQRRERVALSDGERMARKVRARLSLRPGEKKLDPRVTNRPLGHRGRQLPQHMLRVALGASMRRE